MSEYQGGNEEFVRKEEFAYLLAYDEWMGTLSDVERRALEDGGVDVPDLDPVSRSATAVSRDAADLSMAAVSVDFAAGADGPVERLQEAFGLNRAQAEGVAAFLREKVRRDSNRLLGNAISFIAGEFLQAANLKLYAAALAFASDLSVTSGMGSMRQWATRNGLSVAAVSKVSRHLRKGLALGPGNHLRDDRISEICSTAQKKNHWRKKVFKKNNHEHNTDDNKRAGSKQRYSGLGISLGGGKAGTGRKGTKAKGEGKVDGSRAGH